MRKKEIKTNSLNSANSNEDVYKLIKSKLLNEKLIFPSSSDFKQALRDGFFLLEIPKDLDVSSGIKLCYNFFKDKDGGLDDDYKGFKQYDGLYFDREHFQTEHILTDQIAREKYFPSEVKKLADAMNELAIIILKNVLSYIHIPEKEWNLITGKCVNNQGTHWFACSHYRPEINKQGCATHKDTGFVTVLYIDQPGLEAKIGDEWKQIHPEHGYFVVNFGHSFEILTAKLSSSVKSILHRVAKTNLILNQPDRISMAAFTNIPADLNLYQYDYDKPVIYQTVKEFLDEFNKTTWDDKHSEFGLTS